MGRRCVSCGNWCSNRQFSANQWRKGEGSSRCKDCVGGGQRTAVSSPRAAVLPAATNQQQMNKPSSKEELRCSKGHKLQKHHNREDWVATYGSITCDHCDFRIVPNLYGRWEEFYGCRRCNIDICLHCSPTQNDMNRIAPNANTNTAAAVDFITTNTAAAAHRPVIQACCMLAIVTNHPNNEQAKLTAAARGERYNGKRPNYRGKRVSWDDYPDATEFGWTFTGSCEGGRAEFFEKEIFPLGMVKLDFYYTTGTIKTVLDHPIQGVTQLFGKGDSITPQMYRAILMNPREHTGERYHRRGYCF